MLEIDVGSPLPMVGGAVVPLPLHVVPKILGRVAAETHGFAREEQI